MILKKKNIKNKTGPLQDYDLINEDPFHVNNFILFKDDIL